MEFIAMFLGKGLVVLIVVCIYVGSFLGWLMMLAILKVSINGACYEMRRGWWFEAMGSIAGALFCLLFLTLIPWSLWTLAQW